MKQKDKPVLHDFNAAELMKMEIPEPKWAVNEIIPEGLSLLAGKPKRGKSMMALNLGISITNGGLALGRYEAVRGPVIYLALEDTKRRLQTRLKQMHQEHRQLRIQHLGRRRYGVGTGQYHP